MLEVNSIDVYYGDIQALWAISFHVQEGEMVAFIGPNGGGKSTILKTLSGLLKPATGSISFNGVRLDRKPAHTIAHFGICMVPEGRRLFSGMSVFENLELGAFIPEARKEKEKSLKLIYEMFPTLKEKGKRLAGTLSGGEQQMLAIGRGLMSKPKILLLDEPSQGLAPLVTNMIFEVICQINKSRVSILLVEQTVFTTLEIANRSYMVGGGHIIGHSENPKSLLDNEHIALDYFDI
jgi:branched-chain amino acid transport system ATP-binding protein